MGSNQEVKVQYQGRKTSRSGSEKRRREILEASLRIVVREGVRGVRHRAVAKEAGVPLSATTYYFKDISDLIIDTFALFAEYSVNNDIIPFANKLVKFLERFESDEIRSSEVRALVVQELASRVTAGIYCDLTQNRNKLIAQQALLHEAVRDPRLAEIAMTYRKALLNSGFLKACEIYGADDPERDANLLLAGIINVQYEYLLKTPESVDKQAIEKQLVHLFNSLLNSVAVGDSVDYA